MGMSDVAAAVGKGLFAGAAGAAAMTLRPGPLRDRPYGTIWGAVRGLIALRGPGATSATVQHWAVVWGSSG